MWKIRYTRWTYTLIWQKDTSDQNKFKKKKTKWLGILYTIRSRNAKFIRMGPKHQLLSWESLHNQHNQCKVLLLFSTRPFLPWSLKNCQAARGWEGGHWVIHNSLRLKIEHSGHLKHCVQWNFHILFTFCGVFTDPHIHEWCMRYLNVTE